MHSRDQSPQLDAASCQGVAAVIFSSRERPEVLNSATLAAVEELATGGGILDVVINGNRSLVDEIAGRQDVAMLAARFGVRVRLWFLKLGDKAHAWNVYVHELWPGARTTMFIDGYVQAGKRSFVAIDAALLNTPTALGATGVPSVGRSAARLRQEMLTGGGIHGNLYALNQEAMETIRAIGFRLPLGLYRTDPLLGAVLLCAFKPDPEMWEPRRIKVVAEASWTFRALSFWRLSDLITHCRRMLRQGQGRLENEAFRTFFLTRGLPLEELPKTAAELVEEWIASEPGEALSLVRSNWLAARALKRMRQSRDWSTMNEPSLCLFDSAAPRLAGSEPGGAGKRVEQIV